MSKSKQVKNEKPEEIIAPKELTATVKGVPTANRILLQGPAGSTGIPLEKSINLIGIIVQRIALSDNIEIEENYGFEAREYLRNLLIGKKIKFYIELKGFLLK